MLRRLLGGALPLLPVAGFAGLAHAGIRICPIWVLTGIPCAGCGMVRACLELAQGHVQEACRLHPLSPLVAPLLAIGLLQAMAYGARIPIPRFPWNWKATVGLILVLLAVWGARLSLGLMPEPVDWHNGLLTRGLFG